MRQMCCFSELLGWNIMIEEKRRMQLFLLASFSEQNNTGVCRNEGPLCFIPLGPKVVSHVTPQINGAKPAL